MSPPAQADGGGAAANPLAPPDKPFPAFLRPGARITYFAGSSVVQGVGTQLVPDEQGNLVDNKTGKRYRADEMKNSGGVGYLQISIVAAHPQILAADARNYLIADLQNNVCASTGAAALVGNAGELGMYWIHPSRLAGMLRDGGAGLKVTRIAYTLNGQNYDAISLLSGGNGYSSRIYDLHSGLLLAESSSNTNTDVPTLGKDNTITPGKGASYISHSRLVSVRQLNVPWANDRLPQWVAPGRQFVYQGRESAIVPTGTLPGFGMAVQFSIGQVAQNCALMRVVIRKEIGQGLPPQEATMNRCFGSALPTGLWISPQAMTKLQPNQLIDQDPITRFQISFAGTQGRNAILIEQGPMEMSQSAYDIETGLLQAVQTTRAQQTGKTQLQLNLVGQQ